MPAMPGRTNRPDGEGSEVPTVEVASVEGGSGQHRERGEGVRVDDEEPVQHPGAVTEDDVAPDLAEGDTRPEQLVVLIGEHGHQRHDREHGQRGVLASGEVVADVDEDKRQQEGRMEGVANVLHLIPEHFRPESRVRLLTGKRRDGRGERRDQAGRQ